MRILPKMTSNFITLEPNIVWKWLVPFFEVVSSQKIDENKNSEIWPFLGPFLANFVPKFLKHRVKTASTIMLCSFEPEQL